MTNAARRELVVRENLVSMRAVQDEIRQRFNIPSLPEARKAAIAALKVVVLNAGEDAVLAAAHDTNSDQARLAGNYFRLCSLIRKHQILPKVARELLTAAGFNPVRVSEFLRVANVSEEIWKGYIGGDIGFKATLGYARRGVVEAEVSGSANSPDNSQDSVGEGVEASPVEATPELPLNRESIRVKFLRAFGISLSGDVPEGMVRRIGRKYGVGRVNVKRCDRGAVGYLKKYLVKANGEGFACKVRRWSRIGNWDSTKLKDIEVTSPLTIQIKQQTGGRKVSFLQYRQFVANYNEYGDILGPNLRQRNVLQGIEAPF